MDSSVPWLRLSSMVLAVASGGQYVSRIFHVLLQDLRAAPSHAGQATMRPDPSAPPRGLSIPVHIRVVALSQSMHDCHWLQPFTDSITRQLG